MAEDLSNRVAARELTETEQRFIDFVVSHAGDGGSQGWKVEDPVQFIPVGGIDFSVTGPTDKSTSQRYNMDFMDAFSARVPLFGLSFDGSRTVSSARGDNGEAQELHPVPFLLEIRGGGAHAVDPEFVQALVGRLVDLEFNGQLAESDRLVIADAQSPISIPPAPALAS